ncbi:hypothetical protein Tco_1403534 [Tanacetum coccineum]
MRWERVAKRHLELIEEPFGSRSEVIEFGVFGIRSSWRSIVRPFYGLVWVEIGGKIGIDLFLKVFGSMRLRPSLRRLKGSRLRGLVKISAMLYSEETFSIEMFPF